mgnify:CR=1 FL=1
MKITNIKNPTSAISHYVGDLIRKARIQNGITGSELAKQVHLSQQQISRYERGRTGFQLDVLLRLLSALNLDEAEKKRFFALVVEESEGKSDDKIYSDNYFK